MSKEVENYVDRYIKRHHCKIKEICAPLEKCFGINYFTYHSLTPDGLWRPLVSRLDWADHYTEKELYLIDPLQLHPRCYKTGAVFWSHHLQGDREVEEIKIAQDKFEMSHGLCLIERNGENCEFFGFNAPPGHTQIYTTYLNDLPLLKKFCHYFKEETASLLNSIQNDPIDLLNLKGASFEAHHSPFENPNLPKSLFLKCINAEPPVRLSKREKECLNHYLNDLKMQDVADKLDLSVRTVESYLNSIKNKLGCQDKTELLQKGNELRSLGIIT